MEVIRFEDDFLRSRATGSDSLRVGRPASSDKRRSWSREIDSAASEVERVFDATHVAVVLRRPAAARYTKVGMDDEQASNVQSGM